jgi:hypothetical protein
MRGLLPGAEQRPPSAAADAVDAAAAGLVLAGTTIAVLQAIAADRRRRRTTPPAGATHAVAAVGDPSFLALRETLGAAWTLRIAERFDAVASSRGWPCRLRFTGLDCGGDPDDTAWHRDALRAFRALLRRFVTDGWLARHGCHDRSGTAPDSGEEPS